MPGKVLPISPAAAAVTLSKDVRGACEKIGGLLAEYSRYVPELDPARAGRAQSESNRLFMAGYFAANFQDRYGGLYRMLQSGLDGKAGRVVADMLSTALAHASVARHGDPAALATVPDVRMGMNLPLLMLRHMASVFAGPDDITASWHDYVDIIVREADSIMVSLEGAETVDLRSRVDESADRISRLNNFVRVRTIYTLDSRYGKGWEGVLVRGQTEELPNFLGALFYLNQFPNNPEFLEETLEDARDSTSRLLHPVAYLHSLYKVTEEIREGIRIEFPQDMKEEPTAVDRVSIFHLANLLLERVGVPEREGDPPAISVDWEGEDFVVSNRSEDGKALRAFREGEDGNAELRSLVEGVGGGVEFVASQPATAEFSMPDVASIRISVPVLQTMTLPQII